MKPSLHNTSLYFLRLFCVSAGILLMVSSCSEDAATYTPDPNPFLTIHIQSPESVSPATRTDVGDVTPLAPETGLYYTYIWVFESGGEDADAKPVGSLSENLGGAENATLQLSIDREVIARNSLLDIFVVANAESVPSAYFLMGPNNPPVTRKTLKEMVFGKVTHTGNYSYDDFGTANPVHTPEVQKGIPMSQYVLSQKVIDNGMLDKPVNVALRHAVSKMRFVFARETGVTDAVITGITLGNGLIPTTTHLFPTQPTDPTSEANVALAKRTPNLPKDVTYENGFTFNEELANGDILEHPDPASLAIQSGETAQAYTGRLSKAFSGKEKSLYYGLTYLRETGQKLTGTIHYKLGGTPYDIPFEMAEECDFTRNHEYIVYAYFKKSGMGLTVTVQDWDRNDINHEFANTVAVAKEGKIRWTDGTYNQIMAEKYVIMYPNINIHPTFTFNIQSPKGATWYAVLRTLEGDPMAFTLCDLNGNVMEQGIVDNNPITLCVHAREPNPAQNNVAELLFVVRCNGQIIPVTVLTDFDGNYVIVQNKNI